MNHESLMVYTTSRHTVLSKPNMGLPASLLLDSA